MAYTSSNGQICESTTVKCLNLDVVNNEGQQVLDTDDGNLNIYKNIFVNNGRFNNALFMNRGDLKNYVRLFGGEESQTITASDLIRGFFYDTASGLNSTLTFPSIAEVVDELRNVDKFENLPLSIMLSPTIISNNSNDDTHKIEIIAQGWNIRGSRLAEIPSRCACLVYPCLRNANVVPAQGSLTLVISSLPQGGGGGADDWSTFAASSNVNISNFNVDNVNTLTATTINGTALNGSSVSSSSTITCEDLTAVGTITAETVNATTLNASNVPAFSFIDYAPQLQFGTAGSSAQPSGIVYATQSGRGYTIGKFVFLNIDIALTNLGTGPEPNADTYVTLPGGLTPSSGRNYGGNSYFCTDVGGFGGNSGWYPYVETNNTINNRIFIGKWRNTASPFINSPSFSQFSNVSHLSFQLIYETV